MRFVCFVFLASTLAFATAAQATPPPQSQLNVMPLPAKFRLGNGQLTIGLNFSVANKGVQDARIDRALQRFVAHLALQTGIPLGLAPQSNGPATLTVSAAHTSKRYPQLGEDESYTLDIGPSAATLTAPTTLGILRGLQTFLQLVSATPTGFAAPAVHIEDAPRFPWRGLMIDVSRHFIPMDALYRAVDGMELVKLNVFHLHLSDDQGFRLQSKEFPKLTELGSDGNYYTQDQMKALIDYAADRGIRVVPEFDMPGHATSWFVGYPELASGLPNGGGPYAIERRFGIFDQAMDPTRDETYKFLDKFIGEMADLFPDQYFHIGGDEVNGKQWRANPKIQAFMREHNMKNTQELQQYFTVRVQKLVAKHHKFMIGWDEILSPGMPNDIVIQSWRGPDSLAAAAKQGYRGLLSSGYYLDHMQTAAEHYAVEPLSGDAAKLTPEEKSRILGGEACQWAEFLTPDNVDSRLWPRAAAIAERLWSPAEETQDVASMYRRLENVSWRLELLGIRHRSELKAMLGRMAGSDDVAPLRVLADAVRPVGLDGREHTDREDGTRETVLTPMNRLVDAAPPESESARDFVDTVNVLIAGKFAGRKTETAVRDQLLRWRDNDSHLEPLIAKSAVLKELTPVSQNLSALGAAGIQALDFIDRGEKPTADWTTQTLSMIQKAQDPQADVFIAVAPAIQSLVNAANAETSANN
ncbi:MAG TPA: family 20 glycosylhydrolase [Candidatus Acidoferrales bacterium]|nr:family 20 glycosylhydrolase [Candidatus Acidoferrales bacterium]